MRRSLSSTSPSPQEMKKEKEVIKKKDKVSLGSILTSKSLSSQAYDADLQLHTESGQAFLLKWGILGMIYLLGME